MDLLNEAERAFAPLTGMEPVPSAFPGFVPRLEYELKSGLPAPLVRAWELAVFEIESNVRPCPYGGEFFTAGGRGGWHDMLFGQDTTGTALLSLNRLYPDLMKNHLRAYVSARLNVWFLCPEGWELEGCKEAIPVGLDCWMPRSRAFCDRYHMSPALNRTGMDVGWIWAAGDLFDRSGDLLDWAWLYGMGGLFFSRFYQPFFDPADGLYFGQASFIDVGHNGYPLSFGTPHTRASRNAAVRIKAASTNALYVRSLDVMAHAALVLGRDGESGRWQKRADELRAAIREKLRFPDGSFSYFLHRDGEPEPRREALGAAFCVLCDVVRGEEAVRALAPDKIPRRDHGVALFYPFYEENPGVYHNKSAWPFASTFYYLASEKATGKSFLAEDARQLASSVTVPDMLKKNDRGELSDYRTGTFKEYIRWEDGVPGGTNAQSWTISAFLNFALRAGLLKKTPERSRFW